MGIDRFLELAGQDFPILLRRHAQHAALGNDLELRVGLGVFERDVERAAARNAP